MRLTEFTVVCRLCVSPEMCLMILLQYHVVSQISHMRKRLPDCLVHGALVFVFAAANTATVTVYRQTGGQQSELHTVSSPNWWLYSTTTSQELSAGATKEVFLLILLLLLQVVTGRTDPVHRKLFHHSWFDLISSEQRSECQSSTLQVRTKCWRLQVTERRGFGKEGGV